MSRKSNTERITLRINESETKTLNSIQSVGDFTDRSATIRFCINFTKTILSILPKAIGESFIETLENQENE